MVLTIDKKQEIIDEFGRDSKDTGSPEVQVALLTARITYLTDHLKMHRKDFDTRRSLLILVSRRAKLLTFIKGHDEELYLSITDKLSIRR